MALFYKRISSAFKKIYLSKLNLDKSLTLTPVQQYLAAIGSTDGTELDAWNTLYSTLTSAGILSKLDHLYLPSPNVFGNDQICDFITLLKGAWRDGDGSDVNGWGLDFFSYYVDLNWTMSSLTKATANNFSMGVSALNLTSTSPFQNDQYNFVTIQNSSPSSLYELVVSDDGFNNAIMISYTGAPGSSIIAGAGGVFTALEGVVLAHRRSSSNSATAYLGLSALNVGTNSTSNSAVFPALNMFIGAGNFDGSPSFVNSGMDFGYVTSFWIGQSMSQAEIITLNNALNTWNGNFGRAIP